MTQRSISSGDDQEISSGDDQATTQVTPPGFGLATAPASQTMKSPPAGYNPGPLAPVRQEYENSTLYKIGSVLSSWGETVPTNLKIRMAQQDADLKLNENKLAWSNYYKANDLARSAIKQHNQDMLVQGLKLLPMAKDAIFMAKPEDKESVSKYWDNMLEGFGPGLGKVARMTQSNPGHTYIADVMLNTEDPQGKADRTMADSVGYDNWLAHPQVKARTKILGHDLMRNLAAHMPRPLQEKMSRGELSEEEFLKAIPATSVDMGLSPLHMRAAQGYAQEEDGQQALAGLGVKLNSAAMKQQGMRPAGSGNPMNQAKFDELQRVDAKLAHAESNPEAYTKQELDSLTERRNILLRVQSPQGSPGESKSNVFSHSLVKISGGKMQTASDLQNFQAGTHEYAQALTWISQANEEAKSASAQASLGARMQEPAPVQLNDTFSRQSMQQGQLKMVAPQSTHALRTNPDNIHLEKDEQTKFKNLMTSRQAGASLFDMAEKVFKANGGMALAKQQGNWAMTKSEITAGIASITSPDMKVYADVLNAWAGNNAKALGGEVGVLTNVDIDRWVRTFPTGADTPSTIKAKRKIFTQMVDLVQQVATEVLSGNSGASNDPKTRQKIEGLIGSAEGLSKGTEKDAAPRGESLLDRMRKGR